MGERGLAQLIASAALNAVEGLFGVRVATIEGSLVALKARCEALERLYESQVRELESLREVARGAVLTLRGTHATETVYRQHDVVASSGGSWVARLDDPGELPGAGWMLLAQKGPRGSRGKDGGCVCTEPAPEEPTQEEPAQEVQPSE